MECIEPPPLHYLTGFSSEWATEALPGALPVGQNSPQHCPYGLYAEQLSGTAFTAPRHRNRRSWLYRIRPAAVHGPFESMDNGRLAHHPGPQPTPPNQLRWDPMQIPETGTPTDFLDGLFTMACHGEPATQSGTAIHLYAANRSMTRFFYNADGELLVVPQQGRLRIATELGLLDVAPQEFAVMPRGLRFRVELPDGTARGYVCENFGAPFQLPDLGVIGANGLANPRDFQVPEAWYEDVEGEFQLVAKFMGNLWVARTGHSPLDVVAWHGNLAPYKYDLRRFNAIGSISHDHPDPSIFIVLQSPSETAAVGMIDFIVFPPRWVVAERTFRPPWFHRNVASEFMGLVHGHYDAKAEGFLPGGASLHNCMSGHGPDAATCRKAFAEDTSLPRKIDDGLAFMFETRHVMHPTAAALASAQRQVDYQQCWSGIDKRFHPERP